MQDDHALRVRVRERMQDLKKALSETGQWEKYENKILLPIIKNDVNETGIVFRARIASDVGIRIGFFVTDDGRVYGIPNGFAVETAKMMTNWIKEDNITVSKYRVK